MTSYQARFLDFAIRCGALRFGEFRLKSGRVSPYFFNAGAFYQGSALAQLGRFYAETVLDHVEGDFMLFGPAYKGIPLVTATAMALAEHFGRDVGYAFDRKEAKDHGEGGNTVGAPLRDQVVVVDDVVTAGLSIDRSVELIRAAGAQAVAAVVALDRQERGLEGGQSAVMSIQRRHGLPVHGIAALDDLIAYLARQPSHADNCRKLRDYRGRYGVVAA